MSRRDRLIAQIAELESELAVVNRVPEDTFNLGTIALFSPAAGPKWYYVKTAEETWRSMQANDSAAGPLVDWVILALDSNIGYFEIYTLAPAANPIFTSA